HKRTRIGKRKLGDASDIDRRQSEHQTASIPRGEMGRFANSSICEDEYLLQKEIVPFHTRRQAQETLQSSHKHMKRFWTIWSREYLTNLRERNHLSLKHKKEGSAVPKHGKVELLVEELLPRNSWKMGRITKLKESSDGEIREAEVKMSNGRLVRRPLNLLVPVELDETEEQEQSKCQVKSAKDGESTTSHRTRIMIRQKEKNPQQTMKEDHATIFLHFFFSKAPLLYLEFIHTILHIRVVIEFLLRLFDAVVNDEHLMTVDCREKSVLESQFFLNLLVVVEELIVSSRADPRSTIGIDFFESVLHLDLQQDHPRREGLNFLDQRGNAQLLDLISQLVYLALVFVHVHVDKGLCFFDFLANMLGELDELASDEGLSR
ncbi:unnamed protein product, partial [Heligmosomoides polygyrus]|uniref:DUF5641 domain-containing protein n=1 Tax=Heligmosomoides polygyrus TaxID=6339 RepID=A0A183GMN7_HELPZ